MNVQSVIGDYSQFLSRVFEDLKQADVDPIWQIDHICYRVESLERYKIKKQELSQIGVLLGEVIVNGRPISTFKFHEPLKFRDKVIPLIELPSPKSSHRYKEGLEHIEFVIPDELSEFVCRYPHLKFNTHALAKKINAEVELELKSGSAKFHNQSLEDVITLETT